MMQYLKGHLNHDPVWHKGLKKRKKGMEQYDNTIKGVLFKEQGEKKEEWHDDYKGTIDVEGVEYWIGAAVRKSKAGVPYMKLNVRKKESKAKEIKESLNKPAVADDHPEDDIPF